MTAPNLIDSDSSTIFLAEESADEPRLVRIHYQLPEEDKRLLRAIAKKQGRLVQKTLSILIRAEAIRQGLLG